jgi:hypothetical protein
VRAGVRPNLGDNTVFPEAETAETAIVKKLPDLTVFQPDDTAEGVVDAEGSKGRTWPDLAHKYASEPRYHYLILFVVFSAIALSTGHLQTTQEAIALAGVILASWVILFVIQRKSV